MVIKETRYLFYETAIDPTLGFDGSKKGYGWEVKLKKRARKTIGCGSAVTQAKAEAAIESLIGLHRNLHASSRAVAAAGSLT